MKITNKKNLPQIFVNAISNDTYSKGESDFSATELISPAWQNKLKREFGEQTEMDAADMMFAFYGSMIHLLLERGADPASDDLIEERFYHSVAGYMISAQIDFYEAAEKTITDWKFVGAFKVMKAVNEQDYEDWEYQLNIQAYLMRKSGYEVDRLQIGAMCRDWSKTKKINERDYPDEVEVIEIPLWTIDQQEKYIKSRIAANERPQMCTEVERWAKPTTWAMMKGGRKTALKVERSREELIAWGESKSLVHIDGTPVANHAIVERPGKNIRCEGYCSVNEFCDFYKENCQ